MKRASWLLAEVACAALVIAASCSKSKVSAKDSAAATSGGSGGMVYTPADVEFMQGMIGHHAQALVMAAMAPTHGASAQVQLFCKKIDISQRDEIAVMQQWLKDRRQAVPDPNAPMAMPMPGMLTADQLKQLDAARDTTFDRLFLTFMIQHHEGALAMVKALFASPGAGESPEMAGYASGVDADQRAEIGRMQGMLNTSSRSASQ